MSYSRACVSILKFLFVMELVFRVACCVKSYDGFTFVGQPLG